MLKRIIKSTLEAGVALAGPHLWRAGSSLVVLMYHRILPPNDPRYVDEQPGMIVHPDTFDMHLRVAKRHFELVDLHAWLTAAENGEALPKRALAITFDDGWRDNLEYALPVLDRHDAPATIYLVSDMVGDDGNYWPEQLAAAIRLAQDTSGSVWQSDAFRWLIDIHPQADQAADIEAIDRAIVAAKNHFDDATLRERSRVMLEALGDPLRDQVRSLLNWEEVGKMQAGGLITFGSHTVDHTRLTRELADTEMHRQVVSSQRALEQHLNVPVPLFCYPNGDHADKAVDLVSQHYASAVTTIAGWNRLDDDRFRFKRIGVHEGNSNTPAGFLTRLSGWF